MQQMMMMQQQAAMNPQVQAQLQALTNQVEGRKAILIAEMTEEFMKEEKQITSQFDSDPLLKLKSREVDLRAMENERKKQNDEATQDLNRAKLMQAQEIAEDKMEQNNVMATMTLLWGTVYGLTILTSVCRGMIIPFWVTRYSKDIKRD